MAQLRESTTIGGSIAITAKNIHEYLDNVVIEGVGGGLELNKHTFEEYVKIHNITDLDQLSTANDSGLYLTSGGITNPPVALYGSITLPPILTGAYWNPKMFEVDTTYFLTKSPMSDASIILIFNRSNKPTTKDMIILCYHLRTNVWYQMEQNSSTGKFSKKWEVKKEIEREFRAFDKVEGALKTLSDKLAQTDKNVGVHGTRLTKVEALAVENKNETIAIRKDVVPKSDVVQAIGTSTSRIMSQKTTTDELNKKITGGAITQSVGTSTVNVPSQKLMTDELNKKITGGSVQQSLGSSTTNVMSQKIVSDELNNKLNIGDFGVGSIGAPRFSDETNSDLNTTRKAGLYSVQSGVTNAPSGNNSGDSLIEWGWGGTFRSQMFITNKNGFLHTRGQQNGKWGGWNQLATTGEMDKKITGGSVVQDTGTSTTNVPSQKLMTDQIGNVTKITDDYGLSKFIVADNKTNLSEYGTTIVHNNSSALATEELGYPKESLTSGTILTYKYGNTVGSQFFHSRNNNKLFIRSSLGSNKYGGWERLASMTDVDKKLTAGVLTNVEGTSTTNVMSQKGVTDGLNKRITGGTVQQGVGTSTVNVMSQKATTDELKTKANLNSVGMLNITATHTSGDLATFYNANNRSALLKIIDTGTFSLWHSNEENKLGKSIWSFSYSEGVKLVASTADVDKKITGGSIVQSVGSSTVNVPSQKFVTDQLNTKITDHGSLGTKNLDTVIQYGMHHQTANANATTARKYPVALTGTLWVLPSAGVTQMYITYNQGQRIYTRNNYGDKWDAWVENLDTSDIVNALGTATNKVVSQKIVNDVSIRTTTAQSRADSAWTLGNNALAKAQNLKDLANVTTARTNLGLGDSAIRNLTTAQGTSTTLVATQKLVNDVKTGLNTEIGKKITGGSVVQTTGTSTTNVMSQKAVTDAVNAGVGLGLGYNQKWVGVSRATHQNTSNKPIAVSVSHISDGHGGILVSEDNENWINVGRWDGGENGHSFTIVPIGWWYRSSQGNMWVLK